MKERARRNGDCYRYFFFQ